MYQYVLPVVLPLFGGYVLSSLLLFHCPHLLHDKKKTKFRCRHISHRGGNKICHVIPVTRFFEHCRFNAIKSLVILSFLRLELGCYLFWVREYTFKKLNLITIYVGEFFHNVCMSKVICRTALYMFYWLYDLLMCWMFDDRSWGEQGEHHDCI